MVIPTCFRGCAPWRRRDNSMRLTVRKANCHSAILWRVCLRFPDLTSICFMLICRSQLFWGNMVASRGLGPAPIPHRDLNAKSLTEAIRFCLQSEALAAAEKVALEMSEEDGVTAAVASFHRNLPAEHMRCHLIPSEPAAWKFKKAANPPMYLSKMAASILVDYLRVESKHLDPYGLVRPYTSPVSAFWLTDITEQVRMLSDPDQKPTMGTRHQHHLVLTRHQQRCNQGHTRHYSTVHTRNSLASSDPSPTSTPASPALPHQQMHHPSAPNPARDPMLCEIPAPH